VTRRPAALAAGAGAAAGVAAAAYALARRSRRWQVDAEALEAAGLTLPRDLGHHHLDVSDGGSVHVVERGAGPPIVLVHGVTLGVEVWAPQLRRLAGAHRVLAVGQRGHGGSLAGEGGYALERLADDLLEVLAALGVSGAVLAGHSMGGMVAQLLAVRRPDELRRHVGALVLVATAAGPMVPGPASGLLGAGMAGAAGRGLRRADRRGQGILPGDALGAWLARASFGTRPGAAEVALTREVIDRMSPEAMAGLLGPLLAFDVHRRLRDVDLPTTVVVGTRDVLTPLHQARAMVRAIPGATLEVLPGCGHMVMLERPGALCDLLERASAAVPPAG
jgi:pimeloyl-ACP methyl ester carboxylesterase